MTDTARGHNRYATTLDALEARAHVPVGQLVETVDLDPPRVAAWTESQQRDALLRTAGAP